METVAGNLYKEKKVRGFCHLYSGQVSDYLCFDSVYNRLKFQKWFCGIFVGERIINFRRHAPSEL